MVHLGFWLPLLAFPMVGAVLQTIQLRQTIIANCDLIFAVTSNPLCLNDAFINVCSNFFVMAEICRWTRCNFIPQYPDFALLEVVEFSDIAGYQQLVNFCGANNVPLCQFARTMLQLAQQCNSACPQTGAILCVQPGLCTPLSEIPKRSCPIAGTVCCIALPTTTSTTTTMTTTTPTTTTVITTTPTTTTMTTTTPTTTTMTTTTPTTTTMTTTTPTTTTMATTTPTTTTMTTTTPTTSTSTLTITCNAPGVIGCLVTCPPADQLPGATCPGFLSCCLI